MMSEKRGSRAFNTIFYLRKHLLTVPIRFEIRLTSHCQPIWSSLSSVSSWIPGYTEPAGTLNLFLIAFPSSIYIHYVVSVMLATVSPFGVVLVQCLFQGHSDMQTLVDVIN